MVKARTFAPSFWKKRNNERTNGKFLVVAHSRSKRRVTCRLSEYVSHISEIHPFDTQYGKTDTSRRKPSCGWIIFMTYSSFS